MIPDGISQPYSERDALVMGEADEAQVDDQVPAWLIRGVRS